MRVKHPRTTITSPDLLQRYVEMRHKLDREANSIFATTSMLALFDKCCDDTIQVDPLALAKIHQVLNTNILNIWEILDDFIYLVQAKSELEEFSKFAGDSDSPPF